MTADDCAGKATLICPFDTSKVFCGGSCEELGYTYTGSIASFCANGATKVYCPFDSDYSKCEGGSDLDTATLCKNAGYTLGGTSSSGNLVVTTCVIGQTKVPCPYNSSYFKCTGEGTTIQPIEETCASMGYFLQSSSTASSCTYGFKSAGVTADNGVCYKCCSASDNTTGIACLKNSALDDSYQTIIP